MSTFASSTSDPPSCHNLLQCLYCHYFVGHFLHDQTSALTSHVIWELITWHKFQPLVSPCWSHVTHIWRPEVGHLVTNCPQIFLEKKKQDKYTHKYGLTRNAYQEKINQTSKRRFNFSDIYTIVFDIYFKLPEQKSSHLFPSCLPIASQSLERSCYYYPLSSQG